LALQHGEVRSTARQQLAMRTRLDRATSVEHDDSVGIDHRTQSVCDHERRALGEQLT
jgi:hypothetical protein